MFTTFLTGVVSRLKLRDKLAISYTLTFTILLGITFIAIYYIAEKNREEEFYQRLKDKSITTFSILLKVEQIDHDMLQLFDRNTINSLYEEKTMIFDSTGSLLYTSIDDTRIFYSKDIVNMLRQGEMEIKVKEGKYELLALKFTLQQVPYFVITKAFDRYGKSKLQFLAWLLLFSFIIVTMLSLFLSVYLSKRITKPVTDLTNQIEQMSAKDLSVRVRKISAEDEISFLAAKFNGLLDKVENAFKFQYHFVQHVSHELKTPLAVMMANAESALSEGKQERLTNSLRFQINALMDVSNIIDAMLDIAKTENKISAAVSEPIRIDELLFECIEELRFINNSCRFIFSIDKSVESSECITVNGNSRMLKMAVMNLLKNAINFSLNEDPRVELSTYDNQVHVSIVNDGLTLDKDEQQHLFNHLFRGRNSANKKGFGLGLVLAQRIIHLHQGFLHYSITPDKQNCFHLGFSVTS